VPQLARLITGADTSENRELVREHVLSFARAASRPEEQAAAAEAKD